MKKVTLLLISLFILSGCTKAINCTYEGVGYTSEVYIRYQDNKVTDAVNTMTYETETSATNMCNIFKKASDAKDNLKCEDKVITMNNYHESLSEEVMNIDELKEYMENNSYTCK